MTIKGLTEDFRKKLKRAKLKREAIKNLLKTEDSKSEKKAAQK